MPELKFSVDSGKCSSCGACAEDCICGIITLKDGMPGVAPENEGHCLRCQHCMAVCPTGALSVFGLKPEAGIPLTQGALPALCQMDALVRGRRSVRKYKKENVSRDVIDALLASLANAPTGCNAMGLNFVLVDDRAVLSHLLEKTMTMIEAAKGRPLPEFTVQCLKQWRESGSDMLFRGAPHLLIVTAGPNSVCAVEDVNLTLAYFELLARCAGLGTCWCGILKITLDAIPELKNTYGLAPDAYFYSMLFGLPDVHYARAVQRDFAAPIRRLSAC